MEDPIHASQALTGPEGQLDFRPRSPTTDTDKDLALSSTSAALVHIPDELSEHDEACSLRGAGGYYDDEPSFYDHDHGYNSSASSTEHSSASGVLAHYFEEDGNESHPQRNWNSRTSSHSSVSSIPASVLVHPHGSNGTKSLARRRGEHRHEGPFRKPSSVRAIQMHTEDESDGYSSTPSRRHHHHNRRRRDGAQIRSAGSSPLKRSHTHSPSKSVSMKGEDVVNEYPLVLLHCTLLPPSLPVAGCFAGRPNPEIVKDVLPRKYWRRWKLLEEKVGSGYLRDRGVLISHPEDSYDLLEEKLLESLELQRPRLHHGHFLAQEEEQHESGNDEDMDREGNASDDEHAGGDLCPDCGGRVVTCDSQNRKWEVKVFAANGLMRAGAWAAAWREMEKVDVEVSLWLPTDVRRELERRLLEDETASREKTTVHESDTSPKKGLVDDATGVPVSPKQSTREASQGNPPAAQDQKPAAQIDLQTLLVNYIRVLANDKRNIVIALLSIAIAFFAMGSARPSPSVPEGQLQTVPGETVGSASSSAASMSQYADAASARPSTVQIDDALESAGIANSVPASVFSAADIAAAGEQQDTASPEVEEPVAEVSELPDVSMATTTATLLDVPAESTSADDMSTEQSDVAAPAPTESAGAADSAIEQEPLQPSSSPDDDPADLEPDLDSASSELSLEGSGPAADEAHPDTSPEETTEPGVEEPTLEQ